MLPRLAPILFGATTLAAAAAPSHDASSPYISKSRFDGVSWDVRNWRLSSTVLDQGHYQARGAVANGYIGISVASAGPFFEREVPVNGDVISGWPLFSERLSFAGLAGFWDEQPRTKGSNFDWLYQYGGESFISGLPHWAGLILDLGNGQYLDATVNNSTISRFETTYDYKEGSLHWKYRWTPSKCSAGAFDVSYQIFAHKLEINKAVVRMSITPSKDVNATVANVLDGASAVRTSFLESGADGDAIYTGVSPLGVDVKAYIYSVLDGDADLASAQKIADKPYIHGNESTIAQAVNVQLQAGKTTTLTKFVGIASTDAFADAKATARKAAHDGKQQGFDNLLRTHVSEWAQVMPAESVDDFCYENGTLPADDYIVDQSITAVVNPYYLLQNTVSPNALTKVDHAKVNDYSISVGGLSSDAYAGMVFWDAETWMQPGLVAAFPESARRIANYRVALYDQAKENVKTKFVGSQNATYFDESAALYPWTSGRSGNCTGTGPCFDYEYHLNGDIGIALVNQWITSGDDDTFKEDYFPIYDSVATAYSNLLAKNGTKWTLTNMTDPDEYANHVDAGGFTMALMAQTMLNANKFRKQFGKAPNDTWTSMAADVLIIRQNNITLEYTTMNNSVAVKQADVVLNAFPLDLTSSYGPGEALSDLDYYALKQSPDGPAMTYAIFSIVANDVSPSGCSAYTYAQYSYSPYARAPFYQLSEQLIDDASINGGTHPAFPFLTGHGGANQVALYGYLGLRLVPDDTLHISPNLPPQIPRLRFRTFYWRGWPITAQANYTHTTIARAVDTQELDTADQKYANASIKVQVGTGAATLELKFDGTPLVIENRKTASLATVNGNIAQCQPAKSAGEFVPGQFPMSVVDGAASTKWQPLHADKAASVTVALPPTEKSITGFFFDWAQQPPVNATVVLHDEETADIATAAADRVYSFNVKISSPYNAQANDNDIHLEPGNSSTVTWAAKSAKYATLWVEGNQALGAREVQFKNGTGATVAEFAVLV